MSKQLKTQTKLHKISLAGVEESNPPALKPSAYMRGRRPELFSDSKMVGSYHLTREVFEYHLDTLTNRKQESQFEHFSRRLAEKEICPNLIPQTGPTGGGDSKVDTETYPVADEIALRWYEGIGRESSKARWAFAISAKKAWRPKLRSDVDKIVQTNRDYKLIYFISNQFIKDKDRAQLEDELQQKYVIDIRILDRSWIIKCIFENNRVQLAIETLILTGFDKATHTIVGPIDTERKKELDDLEQMIEDSNRYKGVEYQLAEDCLQAAFLARGLELPRSEVEGRFQRAERIAARVGDRQQQLRIVYNRAWTAFWWYDDFDELNLLYARVEELANGSEQATDIELLSNLWSVLHTTVLRGELDPTQAKVEPRTNNLKAELDRLVADKRRPNNALLARTNRLLIDLKEATIQGKRLDAILIDLKEVLKASDGLAEFPVRSVIRIIQELGEFLAENSAYDDLFEVAVSLSEQRVSKGDAGIMLCQRGYQKLQAEKPYEAIRLFGRAQQNLALHEYRAEWVTALAGCSTAYEKVGLLWAARANMLMAANQALSEFWKHGTLIPQALQCVKRLVWLELQLGRIFSVMAWMELADALAHQLLLSTQQQEEFTKEKHAQDGVLGLLLLKTDFWELKWLDFLPQILDRAGLYYSWMALLYALGHEDYLRSEGVIPEDKSSESVYDLFVDWLDQPANDDTPYKPELQRGRTTLLRSHVLGCEIILNVTNTNTSIFLGETILGVLESLLATGLDARVYPYRSKVQIRIQPSDFISGLPTYQTSESDAEHTISIRHGTNIPQSTLDEIEAFRSWLLELVLEIITQFAVVPEPDFFQEQIIHNESGLGRSLNFSEISIAVENILGKAPRFHIADWKNQSGTKRYPLRRKTPWNSTLINKNMESTKKTHPWKPGVGDTPDELLNRDNLKHTEISVFSLINVPLWDNAVWTATGYICIPRLAPYLVLVFKHPEAAKKIFKEWRSILGDVDTEEQLRISIVTGINKKHPSWYKVSISVNPNLQQNPQHSHFFIPSRILNTAPPDGRNLDNFLELYKRSKQYLLVAASVTSDDNISEPYWELSIRKRELNIRPAWEIGVNDPDTIMIQEKDKPIIPNGIKNAPVTKALQRLKKRKRSK